MVTQMSRMLVMLAALLGHINPPNRPPGHKTSEARNARDGGPRDGFLPLSELPRARHPAGRA